VRADGSAIDHLDVAVVGLGDCVHQPIPDACPSPAHEAVVARCPWPIALGQVTPRRTRAQHPENAVQHPPVINALNAPRLVRQQRRDHAPLKVGQIIAALAASLNQINAALRIPFMGSRPSERKLSKALQPSLNSAVPQRSHSAKNFFVSNCKRTMLAQSSNLGSLGQSDRIIDIDAKVAHSVFDVDVTKQNLNGTQVAGRLVDERGLRPSH
jgi:hypothetical protein